MQGNLETQTSLNKDQKEAILLLSAGTFLEYFDLMIYVHMAVLLNEVFFPKTDPFTASLMSALAFCSTYIMRPAGALIFGWIGDNMGRKHTVVITTMLMACSCIIMANLPTYAQVGIAATWTITICRIVQGMSSMGEAIGAELYLAEFVKPPLRHFAVSLIVLCATLGGTTALGIASLVMSRGFEWRVAFWVGAIVALVGVIARTALRETPDFADAKRRIKEVAEKLNVDKKRLQETYIWKKKVNVKTIMAYFFIECACPVWFYISYIHSAYILKNIFHFTTEKIIYQNFIVSIIELISVVIITFLSRTIHPLKILQVKLAIFSIFIIFCPLLLNSLTDPLQLLFFQLAVAIIGPTSFPASAVLFMNFPVLKRFTCASVIYAISRAVMHVIASFGLVYLVDYFGHSGLLIVIVPILLGYSFGILYFKKLEVQACRYY